MQNYQIRKKIHPKQSVAVLLKEDYENGKQEGKEEEKINTAKNMLKENYTIKQIAKITQLNIESIKQIKAEFGK